MAIKFGTRETILDCQREYEMYTYLKATDPKKQNVERFGIPVVYYYGRWEGLILIAITKFDKDLIDVDNEDHAFENPKDVLILIRNFVSFFPRNK